jgi:hypothetical protein
MEVHLPKPLHGWREFAGEVGIIVLGVLIALGAEQFVEALHWRHEVHDTREAIDAELSRDLAALQFRLDQRACVAQRAAELDRWSREIGSGHHLRLKKPVDQPIYFAIRTAVWDSTTGEVMSRMPLEAKLNYAALYSSMKSFEELLRDEADQWTIVVSYEENKDLDRRELHEVRAAINDIKFSNEFVEVFKTRGDEFSSKLGLRPQRDIAGKLRRHADQTNRALCEPLL